MPYIVDVLTGFPPFPYEQKHLLEQLHNAWGGQFFNLDRIKEIQFNAGVKERALSRPVQDYAELNNWEARQKVWEEVALELAIQLTEKMLNSWGKFGLDVASIGTIISNSITGFAVPSIEARLMNKFSFNVNTRRIPIFGLGCLGGASLINRGAEILTAKPKEALLFLSVELCSLTLRFGDTSMANVVASALFGDGAGLVLMVGDQHPLREKATFQHLGGLSEFFPNTERVMGWDTASDGLKIVLSSDVPKFASEKIPPLLKRLEQQMSQGASKDQSFQTQFLLGHPGGPKVLEAIKKSLPEHSKTLELSEQSLAAHGNLSSVSILNILERYMASPLRKPGLGGQFFALGPGFCAEAGALRIV